MIVGRAAHFATIYFAGMEQADRSTVAGVAVVIAITAVVTGVTPAAVAGVVSATVAAVVSAEVTTVDANTEARTRFGGGDTAKHKSGGGCESDGGEFHIRSLILGLVDTSFS